MYYGGVVGIHYTVEALVSDHLGNSEKWSQQGLVTYENGLL